MGGILAFTGCVVAVLGIREVFSHPELWVAVGVVILSLGMGIVWNSETKKEINKAKDEIISAIEKLEKQPKKQEPRQNKS